MTRRFYLEDGTEEQITLTADLVIGENLMKASESLRQALADCEVATANDHLRDIRSQTASAMNECATAIARLNAVIAKSNEVRDALKTASFSDDEINELFSVPHVESISVTHQLGNLDDPLY